MREISTERLVKDVRRVLENPFWIPTLKTEVTYERTHDDHDGTWEGKIVVAIDRMGDVFLLERDGTPLRFRTLGGGGHSQRVRNALMILAEAIRLDNSDRPEPEHNDLADRRSPVG